MVRRNPGYFGLPDEKFCIIYNGIDTEAFHPHLRQQHRKPLRKQLGLQGAAGIPVSAPDSSAKVSHKHRRRWQDAGSTAGDCRPRQEGGALPADDRALG